MTLIIKILIVTIRLIKLMIMITKTIENSNIKVYYK
jgi:hypothetical protein